MISRKFEIASGLATCIRWLRTLSHAKLEWTALFALLAAPCFSTEPHVIPIVEGDDIAFSRVENTEEFSQSRVAQIAQDDKGFMWFGTAYGLNRFDGYGHTVFAGDSQARSQLSGVYVSAITKDRAGRLWVASDQGLDIFDPEEACSARWCTRAHHNPPPRSSPSTRIGPERSG